MPSFFLTPAWIDSHISYSGQTAIWPIVVFSQALTKHLAEAARQLCGGGPVGPAAGGDKAERGDRPRPAGGRR